LEFGRIGGIIRAEGQRDRSVKYKHFSLFRLGMLGVACFAGSVARVAISSHLAHRNDALYFPPGWIVEYPTPTGAYYLAILGGLLVLCAIFWGAMMWAKRKISK
jgi:hypothetical protein